MKFVVLSIICLAAFVELGQANLKEDFEELLALVPVEELRDLTGRFYKEDGGVKRVFNYVKNANVAKKAYADVAKDEDVQALKKWLQDHLSEGSDFTNFQEFPLFPSLSSLIDATRRPGQGLGGWPEYVKQVFELLDLEGLDQWVKQKVVDGGDFADLFNMFKNHRDTYERLMNMRSMRIHLRVLKLFRVNVDAFDKAVREYFGWVDEPQPEPESKN